MIICIGPKDTPPVKQIVINVTSRSNSEGKWLSPFFLGPVPLPDGTKAQNVENAWQYSKVYDCHDNGGTPIPEWFEWSRAGYNSKWAVRYPMGKGRKALYSWWEGRALSYIEAREEIYVPLYSEACLGSKYFDWLAALNKRCKEANRDLYIWDFDCYDDRRPDGSHKPFEELLVDSTRSLGHGFIVRELLEINPHRG